MWNVEKEYSSPPYLHGILSKTTMGMPETINSTESYTYIPMISLEFGTQ